MKKTTLCLAGAMAIALSGPLHAQSIWSNPITGTNPNTSNPYTTGQTSNANITVSGIGRGSGATGTGANDRYNANSWNTTAIDTTAYFTFTLTPAANYEIDFVSFTYNGQASGTGPTSFAFRSSADSFTNNVGSPGATSGNIDLSAQQNVNAAREFRLYAWNTTNSGGTFSVNDFTFNGSVALRSSGTLTWDGGQANGNWNSYTGTASNQSNWDANKIPTSSIVDALVFAGNTQTTTTNNVGGLTVGSITFNSGAGAFTNSGSSVTLNGGVTNNSANNQTIAHALALSNGAHAFNTASGNMTVSGVVSGSGSITKSGGNQLTLSGSNSYTGGTSLQDGTILASNNKSLGTGNVSISGDGQLVVSNGVILNIGAGNSITLTSGTAGYRKNFSNGESFANANAIRSDLSGGLDTTATLRGGVASGTSTFVQMSFKVGDSETSSDVLSLDGNDGQAFALSLTVGAGLLDTDNALGWFDSVDGWELAVAENSGVGTQVLSAHLGYQGTFAQFQTLVVNAGTGVLSDYLGAYGVDTATGEAWAIVNHNSDFAIITVPEPGTAALLAAAGVVLTVFRRRRQA